MTVQVQPGSYHIRGALNGMSYLDQIRLPGSAADGQPAAEWQLGVIGTKVRFTPATATVVGRFADGSPAATEYAFGKGRAWYLGACPAIAYLKEARFVPAELKEKWPAEHRRLLTAPARQRQVPRQVELSQPVIEAGVYDSPQGSVLVLANFTYEPVPDLRVGLPVARPVRSVRSLTRGDLPFTLEAAPPNHAAAGRPQLVRFALPLGLDDIVLCE